MRIVHIEDLFYPEAGYQVNILAKYEVLEGHEVYIITSPMEYWSDNRKKFWGTENLKTRDEAYEAESGAKIIRYPARGKYSTRILYEKTLYKYIEELKPDIVFVHTESSFVTLHYLRRFKRLPFALFLDSHTLEMASCNRYRNLFYLFYRLYFTPIIKKNQIKIIRTQDDDFLMKRLGIPEDLAPFISFGSDLTAFHPDKQKREILRAELGISEDAFVIINTGKLTPAKGGKLLAEAIRKRLDTDRAIVLITVGSPATDDYGIMVNELLDGSENTVIRIPTQKYYDLAKYYQASDLCVFAKQCSLSFYDAQACGLPVIVEKNKVNSERVSHNNGITFEPDNLESLINALQYFISMPENEYKQYSKNAAKFVFDNYNYENVSEQFTTFMKEEVAKFVDRKTKK